MRCVATQIIKPFQKVQNETLKGIQVCKVVEANKVKDHRDKVHLQVMKIFKLKWDLSLNKLVLSS
jgi:hypothetical protein